MDPQLENKPINTNNPINQSAQPVQIQPKDSHGITIATMALFVLLSLGAVAFLYYQNQQLKGLLASYQTTTVSPTPAATSDATANWKQVTGKYWTFKAPQELHYISCGPEENVVVLDPTIKSDQKTSCASDNLYLVTILRVTTAYPVATTSPAQSLATQGNSISVLDTKQITIGGKPATYQTESQEGGQFSGTLIRAYVKSGTDTYLFTLTDTSRKDLFNQILSTFKFISSSPTPTIPVSSPSAVPNMTY